MNAFVRYNSVIAAFILLPLFLAVYMALGSQPLSGDLTRIGGHLEEDFGWNEPQKVFQSGRFVMAKSITDLDHHYDVVVIGDSFSADRQKGWQNYLVENTGLSVITFGMAYGFSLEDVVTSAPFKDFPPKILIYESVERRALQRLHEFSEWDVQRQVSEVEFSLHSNNVLSRDYPKREHLRKVTVDVERLLSEAANRIEKSVYRLTGSDKDRTVVLPLKQGNLFSNGTPDKLLVLRDDLQKKFSDNDIATAIHGLLNARSLVEANGKTKFVFLMFPDKLTAYSPFLSPGTKTVPSAFPALAKRYPLLRLDQRFHSELLKGAKDLYLPNDTHTGYYGYKMAAMSLIDYLLQ